MERFDCPVCDWLMRSSYYPGRRVVELFCVHCHVRVEMGFDRNDPAGWPVTVRMELERIRERLWGSVPTSFDQSTLPTLTNTGLQGNSLG